MTSKTDRLSALLAAALALAGCGGPLGEFRPLYATAAGPGLSRIESRAPDGRAGYLLREDLDDAFGVDRSQPPLYRLNLVTKESRVPRGLRIDNVANRYELTLKVDYVLIDIGARKALTRGTVASLVTYDSADQAYAGVAAHLDGEKRAAADVAQRLRVSLASYFANPQAVVDIADAPDSTEAATLSDRLSPQDIRSPSQRAQQPNEPAALQPGSGEN